MPIPEEFLTSLAQRAVATDLIGEHVQLKVVGNRGTGLCPFHDEKTPSFSVNNDLGTYYCFGCHAKGNIYSFLMHRVGLTFVEAVEHVASRYGETIPQSAVRGRGPRPEQSQLLELLDAAQKYFRKSLLECADSDPVRSYLNERGLSTDAAETFGIGFAPAGSNGLKNALEKRSEARLLEAGLLKKGKNGRAYDYFRNRLMFPIRNTRGEVISFGGRLLDTGSGPKYLNGPDSPVFRKRAELYGLYEARARAVRMDKVLLVEGYMDVVMLSQHGFPLVVAPMGTAASGEQLGLLYRYTNEVVCCFDGDDAGRSAAWRALLSALPLLAGDKVLRFAFLPSDHDPDSLVRAKGPDAMREHIEASEMLSSYFFRHLYGKYDLEKPEYRAQMAREAMAILSKISDGPFQRQMIAELKDRVGDVQLGEGVANGLEAQWDEPGESPPRTRPAAPENTRDHAVAERLLAYPMDVAEIDAELIEKAKRIAPKSAVCFLLELISEQGVNDSLVLLQQLQEHRKDDASKFADMNVIRVHANPGARIADLEDGLGTFVSMTHLEELHRKRERRQNEEGGADISGEPPLDEGFSGKNSSEHPQ